MNATVLNNRLDKWLQRAAVAAMVSVGVLLVGLGIALYAPRSDSQADKSAEVESAKVTTIESVATATVE